MLLSFITVVYKGVDHLVPGYSYLSWAASRNPDDVNASMHDNNYFLSPMYVDVWRLSYRVNMILLLP